jgi:hypothetical protein
MIYNVPATGYELPAATVDANIAMKLAYQDTIIDRSFGAL